MLDNSIEGLYGRNSINIKNNQLIWRIKINERKLYGKFSKDSGWSWSNWQEILAQYTGGFSFTISRDNTLHIICLNENKELIYCFWQENISTNEYTGFKINGQEKVIYLKPVVDKKGDIYLLVFIENKEKEYWKIICCIRKSSKWSKPEIIDSGQGHCPEGGTLAVDSNNNLFLIYQIFKKGHYQLVYRKKISDYSWTEKVPINISSESCFKPTLVIDQKGIFHLAWLKSKEMNVQLFYKCKTQESWLVGGWQREIQISETQSGVSLIPPLISISSDKLIIYWIQKNEIYKSISYDYGKTFSQPVLFEKIMDFKNEIIIDLNKISDLNLLSIDTFNLPLYLVVPFNLTEKPKEKENVKIERKVNNENLIKYLKETIEEKTEIIKLLEQDLKKMEQEQLEMKKNEEKLENVIKNLKENIINNNQVFNSNRFVLERKLKSLEEENNRLKHSIKVVEENNNKLRKKVEEKEKRIVQLEEKEKQLNSLLRKRFRPFPFGKDKS